MATQRVRIRGVVQGVGFRPFVLRLAKEHGLTGWVLNDEEGVHIHAEGAEDALTAFTLDLAAKAPRAARIDTVATATAEPQGCAQFRIRGSERNDRPSAGIAPDLPVCDACLTELFDTADRRAGYPYINCTECGPRYSIVLALPYDRANTTMRAWPMCARCAFEFDEPADRRFHAQPVACPECGPHYQLKDGSEGKREGEWVWECDGVGQWGGEEDGVGRGERSVGRDAKVIREAAAMLARGKIIAIKGLGGYHLACDAANEHAVRTLRERKFRKERPFALMVRDLETARRTVDLSADSEALLTSMHRPIVLAPARVALAQVAPDHRELGVMLPYTPLHHLLFEYGAPDRLVMTSANRSSEPIAYREDEARERLIGLADAFLVGERPIARRVDDSVVRVGAAGPVVLRRSRGYAPATVARIPGERPTLALGADLKNAITLVVRGDATVSQHIGDLDHFAAFQAFRETVGDLTSMYAIDPDALRVVHDLHPQYASTSYALTIPCGERIAVQHHRAHIASVLAERGAFEERVVGVAFDGSGYGDDGSIWGGEFFAGSVAEGLERVGHLRAARLPGGDAAARYPVQAAAGYLAELGLDALPDLCAAPFHFPERFQRACELVKKDVRSFPTTSAGRLFDTVAALLGFTRAMTFEGQAAVWLEQLAVSAARGSTLSVPAASTLSATFSGGELDFRPVLTAVIEARERGRPLAAIARGFHAGLARGIRDGIATLCEEHGLQTAVLSGGVFQNDLLLHDVLASLAPSAIRVWTNREVPPNDGGISLGQAALALR